MFDTCTVHLGAAYNNPEVHQALISDDEEKQIKKYWDENEFLKDLVAQYLKDVEKKKITLGDTKIMSKKLQQGGLFYGYAKRNNVGSVVPHGPGVMVYKKGMKYFGMFKDGKRHGYGRV